MDDLLSRQLATSYNWILVMKHEAASTIKVWNTVTNVETDVSVTNILQHLRAELRERDQSLGIKLNGPPSLSRHHSQHGIDDERDKANGNVQVLFPQHKSKKGNKFQIVQAAKDALVSNLNEMRDAPLLAIETTDDTLRSIGKTKLSDSESRRNMMQKAPAGERNYLRQVFEWLEGVRDEGTGKGVGLYNIRTGTFVPYDLGA